MFKNKKIVRRFNKNYFFKLFEFFGNFFIKMLGENITKQVGEQ